MRLECENRHRLGVTSFLLSAVVLSLMGCGSDFKPKTATKVGSEDEKSVSDLTGNITADGSSTVAPISILVSDRFRETFPKVDITVGVTGTGNGFKRFTKGETDISDASRPIKPEEFKQCQENGVEFVELPIAYDGLTIVVNPANDWVEQLTIDDIKKIFLEETAAKTWKDLNDAWPAEPIKLFSPGTGSGTFDYFKEVLGKGANVRPDMSLSENDNILVQGVSSDKYALGFFGAAYYFPNMDKVKAVKIVNPETGKAVLPSMETVVSGEYAPYSRPLFIYVNLKSMKKPTVQKFVDFYLANGAKLAEEVKYFPLPAEVYASATANFKDAKAGSHFITAEGTQREGSFLELFKPENLVNIK